MRALVKAERAEGLVMRDEPIPEIGSDDILIKVRKTGICGTDLHIWKLSLIHISEPTRPY